MKEFFEEAEVEIIQGKNIIEENIQIPLIQIMKIFPVTKEPIKKKEAENEKFKGNEMMKTKEYMQL